MRLMRIVGWMMTVGVAWLAPSLIGPASGPLGSVVMAQQAVSGDVTFARDIAPILQRSCQNCHRPGQVELLEARKEHEGDAAGHGRKSGNCVMAAMLAAPQTGGHRHEGQP